MNTPTGTCPVCLQVKRMTKDAVLYAHGDCPGSGVTPRICQFCHAQPGFLLTDPYESEVHNRFMIIVACPACVHGRLLDL